MAGRSACGTRLLLVTLGLVMLVLVVRTMRPEVVECEVCVAHANATECATAGGATVEEALRRAIRAACETHGIGGDALRDCLRRAPERTGCK